MSEPGMLPRGQLCRVPTYDGSFECTHPSVVDSVDLLGHPWHGYRYWMAFTPFPGNAPRRERLENPSIAASDDGERWVIPEWISNPLVGTPGFGEFVRSLTMRMPPRQLARHARGTLLQLGYNADPALYLSRTGVMYLAYAHSLGGSAHDELLLIQSSDGWRSIGRKRTLVRTWEEPHTREINVPSIVEQEDGGRPQVSLYYGYVPMEASGQPRYDRIGIRRRSGPDLESLGAATTLKIVYPPGQRLWHHEIRRGPHGRNVCLGTFFSRGSTGFPPLLSLYYGEFADRDTLVFDDRPILQPSPRGWDSRCIYKPSFLFGTNGRSEAIRLWYSAQDATTHQWRIGATGQETFRRKGAP